MKKLFDAIKPVVAGLRKDQRAVGSNDAAREYADAS